MQNNEDTEGEFGSLPTMDLFWGPFTYEIQPGKTKNFQMGNFLLAFVFQW